MSASENPGGIDPDMLEIIDDFVAECRDVISEVEPALVQLDQERDPEVVGDTLGRAFRLFHSVKGSAGFIGLERIVKLTHVTESLLPPLRDDPSLLTPEHVTCFCAALDDLARLLDAVENNRTDAGVEVEPTIARLTALANTVASNSPAPATSAEPLACAPPPPEPAPEPEPEPNPLESLISPEVWEAFRSEIGDQFDEVESLALQLDKGSCSPGEVDAAFRAMHTFKGNCGFVGFADAEEVAMALEDLLDRLREGKPGDPQQRADALLLGLDRLRTATSSDTPSPIKDAGAVASTVRAVAASAAPPEKTPEPPTPATAPEPENKGDNALGATTATHAAKYIRVDVRKLDALLDQVGELITTSASITQSDAFKTEALEHLQQPAALLNRVTTGLHDTAMSMRMVPLGTTFRKMVRVVRDVSKKVGKKVELQLQGEDTEVDKTIIESLADPLVHMIRNSIDHGIEPAQVRAAAGKAPTGYVRLGAKHQGGEVWITIEDDGGGIDPAKLIAKAKEKGLVGDEADSFTDQQAFQLLFMPGFSTAKQVTGISGRGVGMDVVRRNLEAVRGRVDVASQVGKGTCLTIRIPLTLAIIDAMLARVGERIYAFPVLSIRASVRVEASQVIEFPDGAECLRIRERVFEILRLHRFHDIEGAHENLTEGIVVLLEDAGQTVAVFVDEIIGQRQIVIKTLEKFIGEIRGVSGCSVTGTGEITLVIDASDLLRGRDRTRPEHDEAA